MLIMPINRDYNHRLNFQAANRVGINPKISREVRALADIADNLFESIVKKQPVVDGVSVSTVNITRINRVPYPDDEVVTLSGKIDGQDAALIIYKNNDKEFGESTTLRVRIGKPAGGDKGIFYRSNYEGEEVLKSVDTQNYPSYSLKGFHPYKKRNAFFEKYVGALLKPAEKINKLYNP